MNSIDWIHAATIFIVSTVLITRFTVHAAKKFSTERKKS